MKKILNTNNTGTAAFPIWTVWADYEDAKGITMEHLSEAVARFHTKKEAEEYINEQS